MVPGAAGRGYAIRPGISERLPKSLRPISLSTDQSLEALFYRGGKSQTRTPPDRVLVNGYVTLLKYSFDPTGSGFMVFSPGFQLAGQTSPFLATYW